MVALTRLAGSRLVAMAGVEVVLQIYKGWGIHVLVLLSLAMQVTLLITAEIRRRRDSSVLKVVVWLAYLMSDSTAIFALGHMSMTSRSPEQQQLMALWAPFLLLHLGGQDNITAYAMEDNRLWLRHLQALAVQVAAAAYVLYESSVVSRGSLLRRAIVLVFVVGVVKYGERVWALKCASVNGASKNYGQGGRIPSIGTNSIHMDLKDTEGLLRNAHLLLPGAQTIFNRLQESRQAVYFWVDRPGDFDALFTLAEMQLSLMHDVFYSKADVIHTWYGLLIRIVSWASTAAAFLLFHRSGQHRYYGYSRGDVGVTYALLVGAVVLEATSLLRAIFSSWALMNMKFLRPIILPLRRLVLPDRRRWWSDSMGQHNLFKLYGRRQTSRSSKIARWMRLEEPWNTMVHSSCIPVPKKMKLLLVKLMFKYMAEHSGGLSNGEVYLAFGMSSSKMEFDECILVWHVATEVYLRWYKDQDEEQAKDQRELELVEAIEVLSNYMLFLLAARPYMLSVSVRRLPGLYPKLCGALDVYTYGSTHDFVSSLTAYGKKPYRDDQLGPGFDLPNNETLLRGSQLGAKLIGEGLQGTPEDNKINQIAQELLGQSTANSQEQGFHEFGRGRRLKLVTFAWACMLIDVSTLTNPDSHCKQLSNGGELVTVVALMRAYIEFRYAFGGGAPRESQSGDTNVADV